MASITNKAKNKKSQCKNKQKTSKKMRYFCLKFKAQKNNEYRDE